MSLLDRLKLKMAMPGIVLTVVVRTVMFLLIVSAALIAISMIFPVAG